jgi:hypothetical protein
MPIRKGGKRKTFQPMTLAERQRLEKQTKNPNNITYEQIAKASGLSKAQVIEFCKRTGFRSKGNLLGSREVKRPKVDARLKERAENIRGYYKRNKGKVSINELQRKFGGEKKFIKSVIENL